MKLQAQLLLFPSNLEPQSPQCEKPPELKKDSSRHESDMFKELCHKKKVKHEVELITADLCNTRKIGALRTFCAEFLT